MKKLISIVLCFLLISVIFTLPASASNHSDTTFRFYFTPSSSSDFEAVGRKKEDATGTYIKFLSGSATSVKFVIYGGNYQNWAVCDRRYNETKGGYAFIFRGDEGCIRQYVYENRYSHYNMPQPYAFITGFVDIVNGGVLSTAEGIWSPDTVGSYQYFN